MAILFIMLFVLAVTLTANTNRHYAKITVRQETVGAKDKIRTYDPPGMNGMHWPLCYFGKQDYLPGLKLSGHFSFNLYTGRESGSHSFVLAFFLLCETLLIIFFCLRTRQSRGLSPGLSQFIH